jgi:hypothetical protein
LGRKERLGEEIETKVALEVPVWQMHLQQAPILQEEMQLALVAKVEVELMPTRVRLEVKVPVLL